MHVDTIRHVEPLLGQVEPIETDRLDRPSCLVRFEADTMNAWPTRGLECQIIFEDSWRPLGAGKGRHRPCSAEADLDSTWMKQPARCGVHDHFPVNSNASLS